MSPVSSAANLKRQALDLLKGLKLTGDDGRVSLTSLLVYVLIARLLFYPVGFEIVLFGLFAILNLNAKKAFGLVATRAAQRERLKVLQIERAVQRDSDHMRLELERIRHEVQGLITVSKLRSM